MVPILTQTFNKKQLNCVLIVHFLALKLHLLHKTNVNKWAPYWLSLAMGFGWLTKTGRALVGSQSPLRNLGLRTVGNVQALGANQIAAFSPKPHG